MDQKRIAPFVIVAIFVVVSVVAGIGIHVATRGGGDNSGGNGGVPPSASISISAHASSSNVVLTISYMGDDVNILDLQVQGRDSTGTMQIATLSPSSGTLSAGGTLTATYAYGASPSGNVIAVYIIHTPSKQKMFSSSAIVVQ
jgi:hypothetical protein